MWFLCASHLPRVFAYAQRESNLCMCECVHAEKTVCGRARNTAKVGWGWRCAAKLTERRTRAKGCTRCSSVSVHMCGYVCGPPRSLCTGECSAHMYIVCSRRHTWNRNSRSIRCQNARVSNKLSFCSPCAVWYKRKHCIGRVLHLYNDVLSAL